jgi:hypothetical protein
MRSSLHNASMRSGMTRRAALLAFFLLFATNVKAEAWLDAGDSALRSDIQYLVDSGVSMLC